MVFCCIHYLADPLDIPSDRDEADLDEDIRVIPLWCYSLHGLRTKKNALYFSSRLQLTSSVPPPSLKYSIRGTRGKYSPYFQWRGKYANKGRTLPHTHVQILLRAVKKICLVWPRQQASSLAQFLVGFLLLQITVRLKKHYSVNVFYIGTG